MKIVHLQALCGFASFGSLALVILFRQRKLTLEDIGPLFAVFTAASSLPVAIRLCSFALPVPPGGGSTMLSEMDALYISVAGLMLFVTSAITVGKLFSAQISRRAFLRTEIGNEVGLRATPEHSSHTLGEKRESAKQERDKKVG